MQKRKLGQQGLEVSELGLGCMGMSFAYGHPDDSESIRVLHRSLELGINFWDTAQIYGPFTNEELLGKALVGKPRDKIIIASKFAWKFGPKGEQLDLDGSPENVKKSLEGILKRLGTDYLDLYYQHRLDPNIPIEETVGAMAELVKSGKVRYIGLSEVGPNTIKRAHAVHPISAIQSEYSLWERGVEQKILLTIRELGIGFVPYSPIGRGFLTNKIKSLDDLEKDDWRRISPRLQGDNLKNNLKIVEMIQEIASQNNATAAQVALAWVLKQGNDIVPIPGTKHVKYLEENVAAAKINLPESAWKKLESAIATISVLGDRYPEALMKTIDKD